MSRHPIRYRVVCGVLGAVVCANAAHADAEHDRIGAARTAANAKLAEQERECATRFAVSSCLEDARGEHRATLAALRQQELKLDEARRRESAAARRKAIAERVDAQAARASEAQPEAPSVRLRHAPAQPASAPAARPGLGVGGDAKPAPSATERAAAEQRSEARFRARAEAARAHREAVAQRNAERLSKGKAAAPLPVPSAPH